MIVMFGSRVGTNGRGLSTDLLWSAAKKVLQLAHVVNDASTMHLRPHDGQTSSLSFMVVSYKAVVVRRESMSSCDVDRITRETRVDGRSVVVL